MNPFHNKFFTFTTALLLTGSLFACKSKKNDPATAKGNGPSILRAEGFVVKTQAFSNQYATSGSLLPNEQVEIHPEVAGRVTGIFFKEGSAVRKGQTLLQLNDGDILANIRKLKAQRQLQVKTLARQKELLDIGGISRQDYESTETQISSVDADIAFQQEQLRKTRIVAPFDGTIGLRGISVGAVVDPSTIVAALQQVHPLKMDFTVPEQYRDLIRPGLEVRFAVDGSQDTFSGKVVAVDPGADVNTRAIRARAIVPNPDHKLTPGAYANVIIPFQTDNNAILVPSQAIIPTTKDKKVAVVQGGKVNLVVVELGSRTEDKVEILSGLQPGDTILTTGMMQVKQGMNVQVTKVKG